MNLCITFYTHLVSLWRVLRVLGIGPRNKDLKPFRRVRKHLRQAMNEARLSYLPFWGPSEGFFLIDATAVGLTRMKRSSFGLRVRVNPWVNLGERFIRVNPKEQNRLTGTPKRQVA